MQVLQSLKFHICFSVCKAITKSYFGGHCLIIKSVCSTLSTQGFPQDKIIAGRSVIIAGHIVIIGLIF